VVEEDEEKVEELDLNLKVFGTQNLPVSTKFLNHTVEFLMLTRLSGHCSTFAL